MRTFLATLFFSGRLGRHDRPLLRVGRMHMLDPARLFPRRAALRSQSGLSLIEVLVSALLVSLITVGTFTAFGSATRASVDEKVHAEAVTLAGEDEERLRTTKAEELASLTTTSGGESRSVTLGATIFTITSSARYVSAEKETYSCETVGASPDYVQTTSSVTWKSLGTHSPVVQSSIVTNSASGLLVRVANQRNEPLEGVTVTVVGATTSTQTTSSAGCVTFLGVNGGTNNEVVVSAAKGTFVEHSGKPSPISKTYTLSPTRIVSAEFVIAEPGWIKAEFRNEKTTGTLTAVQGETFVAAQGGIPAPQRFVGGAVGLTNRKPEQEQKGLFPFTTIEKPSYPPEPYTAYAGDCAANDPKVVTGTVEDAKVNVEPGKGTIAKLEEPAVNIKVYETAKSVSSKKLLAAANFVSAMFINTECKGLNAQNYTEVPYKHEVELVNGEIKESFRYQPYAKKLEFCVVGKISGKYYKYTTPTFENKTKLGTYTPPYPAGEIYLPDDSTSGALLTCP